MAEPKQASSNGKIPPFKANPVESEAQELNEIDFDDALKQKLMQEAVESVGREEKHRVVMTARTHGFVQTIGYAFDRHYPVSLSPSHIWLLILQGVAKHLDIHSERLRDVFVNHEGKQKIEVRRDDFVKGKQNPWEQVFPVFCEKMKSFLKGNTHALFTTPYSTTTPTDQAVTEITMMDALKDYFDFGFRTRCGIPEVYLEGTVADWRDLYDRVEQLMAYDPSDRHYQGWMKSLMEVASEFHKAAQGSPTQEFWESMFKQGGGSGGPFINGWINALFPYLVGYGDIKWKPNKKATDWRSTEGYGGGGPCQSDLDMGLSCAPFTWNYFTQEFEMKFLGGFFGVEQDPETLALRPCVAWAVSDRNEKSEALTQKERRDNMRQIDRRRREKVNELEQGNGHDIRKWLRDVRLNKGGVDWESTWLSEESQRWGFGPNQDTTTYTEEDVQNHQDKETAFDAWLQQIRQDIVHEKKLQQERFSKVEQNSLDQLFASMDDNDDD